MSSVKVVAYTIPVIDGVKTPEEFVAYAARVSNPSNQFNTQTSSKLLKYLIKNKHWSPFQMVSVCMEIETTRDISHQIVRHSSFAFQQFSQRYSLQTEEFSFEIREARLQDNKNRQNSIELKDNEELKNTWEFVQNDVARHAESAYKWAIQNGIAKEQARVVLPEGNTKTRLYMSGSLRSWIHYIDVRATEGTQKEHRIIAIAAREEIIRLFPSLKEYFFPVKCDMIQKLDLWRKQNENERFSN